LYFISSKIPLLHVVFFALREREREKGGVIAGCYNVFPSMSYVSISRIKNFRMKSIFVFFFPGPPDMAKFFGIHLIPECRKLQKIRRFFKIQLILNINITQGGAWRSIWKVRVPTRVAFFTWTVASGKF
jgi:hypothetical protein